MNRAGTDVLRQVLGEALNNLQIVKGRTVLALIGIAIGTAAVIAMVHVGSNARAEAMRQFEAMGLDVMTITPQFGDGTAPDIAVNIVQSLARQGIGIDRAAALIRSGGNVRVRRNEIPAELLAATDELYQIGKAGVAMGRPTSDLDGFSPFAVLGWDIAAQATSALGRPVAVGDQITIGTQVLTVIGVLASTMPNLVLNLDFNRSVIVPFGAARRLVPNPKLNIIVAQMSPGAGEEATTAAVKTYFLRSRTEVTAQTARQMIAGVDEQMRIYSLLLLAIGTVSLVVGGVGIMNVMLMTVVERRQEIGLRQAIGARRTDIRIMFLAEALTLSIVGGAIGTGLGSLAGWIFAWASGWQFSPSPMALPLGAGMAIVVGLFFGAYPAEQAARLDPIIALRSQ